MTITEKILKIYTNKGDQMIKRAVLIVLDSVGAGELPDAADYGDVGRLILPYVFYEFLERFHLTPLLAYM